jgi:hypothetical protein
MEAGLGPNEGCSTKRKKKKKHIQFIIAKLMKDGRNPEDRDLNSAMAITNLQLPCHYHDSKPGDSSP